VTVSIKRTRFKIKPPQAEAWIKLFGVIVTPAAFVVSSELNGIVTDEITCTVKLRKHVPNLLPAYGRKMSIRYPGQPIQCGRCMDVGHLRADCKGENVEWASYVKYFVKEKIMPVEMIGTWINIIKE